MEKRKVSIIVPVYNVQNYLRQCIDSLINQTYTRLEIILIDDGSTDSSGAVCDEYLIKDTRIKVIHKENGGLSDARNVGIDAAKGEYIAFVDSDDFISPFFIEIMLKALLEYNADLSMVRKAVYFWNEDCPDYMVPILKILDKNIQVCSLSPHDALERMLYQDINTGAQFKFLKRETLADIRFPVGELYEDMATTYKMIQHSTRIALVDAPVYAYRKRMDSIVRQKYHSGKLVILQQMERMAEDILSWDPDLKKAFAARTLSNMYHIFLQIPVSEKRIRNQFWNNIKKCRMTVLLDRSPYIRKKNKIGALVSFLGKDMSYYLGRRFGQKGVMYK